MPTARRPAPLWGRRAVTSGLPKPFPPRATWVVFETHQLPEQPSLSTAYWRPWYRFSGPPALLQGPGLSPASAVPSWTRTQHLGLDQCLRRRPPHLPSRPEGENQTPSEASWPHTPASCLQAWNLGSFLTAVPQEPSSPPPLSLAPLAPSQLSPGSTATAHRRPLPGQVRAVSLSSQ